MKKIMLLVLPFTLAACGTAMQKGSVQDYNVGLVEETLGGTFGDVAGDSYLLAAGPRFHIGAPFRIENVQYNPSENVQDNEVGIAGIIPLELRGVQTTNGEIFNPDRMLATSKVLPLPTIARVTNLENGRSVVVRVNNRGPFVNTRIMDVSPAAARALGMTGQTRVQVQIMTEESARVRRLTLGETDMTAAPAPDMTPVTGTGPFAVQVGAFFAEDSARQLARRIAHVGHATVILEDGMHKVRISGLDAAGAREAIDSLRRIENLSPGLLENGRWVNADSI
jgi:rare lipoprotein A